MWYRLEQRDGRWWLQTTPSGEWREISDADAATFIAICPEDTHAQIIARAKP